MRLITTIVLPASFVAAVAALMAAPVEASAPKTYGICKAIKFEDGANAGHLCKTSNRASVWHAVNVVGTTEVEGATYYLGTSLKG